MVHSPSHTAGVYCPYFPDEGLVYTGDIDLTRFGPWYFGADGDIDGFIRSSRVLLDLDARWYLTGHEAGLLGRAEFAERLDSYLQVIATRDRRIQALLADGVSPGGLARHHLPSPLPCRPLGAHVGRHWHAQAPGAHGSSWLAPRPRP